MEKGLEQVDIFIASLQIYLPKVIGAIITLIVGFWLVGVLGRWLNRRLIKADLDVSLARFFSSIFSITLKVMLLLSVAAMFGVATTSFVALFGAVAFAIGMALQGNLGHLASGVMLMIFKPFRVGDLVDLNGNVGVVESINAFNTTLLTLQNRRIFISNGNVTGNTITNISGQEIIGVDQTFGISYDGDIDQARDIIIGVARSCPWILQDPAILVQVSELGDNSVNFLSRPWCRSEHYWDVFFYMNEHVKKELDKADIGIPYPQLDVHMIPTTS